MRRWLVCVSVAMLLCSAPRGARAEPPAPTKAGVDEARGHFQRGIRAYKAGDFRSALLSFQEAYKASPNYRVLYNIGRSYGELQDFASAIPILRQYLEEGGAELGKARRAEVDAELERMGKQVVTLVVSVSEADADVIVDGEQHLELKSPIATTVLVNAGSWSVTAKKASIQAGKSRFALQTLEADDFPTVAVNDQFAASFALAVADVLIVAREREDRQLRRVRGTMLRERRRTQSREELIANLSHDLRNPLAIALGFAEMAEDDSLSAEDRASALSGIRRSLWEMSQMVENVLDGCTDQAGALVPLPEPLDLEGLCDEALAATRILLRRRPIVLTGSLEPGLLVFADRNRLARVIGNLLGNAVKYTVAGEIRLQTLTCGRFAVIRVQDTGPGIAPDALPHIFDRYRRAHAGGPAGAGLGLAIAHRLTERMGGTLEVESELGSGSTFTITLPLCETRLAPPEPARGESVAA